MTGTEEFPALPSLVISPNLQALLEFDDRLRTPSETHERSGAASADLTQSGQYPVWRQQEVPTISLPPPRRKKSVVAGVPMSPKTISECQSVSSSTNTFSGVGEFGGPGEMMFARSEDVLEDEMELGSKDLANPYLNSPPSSPRYFYPRSDDEEGGIDQPSFFYTLEKPRSMRRSIRKRFGGDQSPRVECRGSKAVSPRCYTSLGCNVGSRPKEKGKQLLFFVLFFLSQFRLSGLPSKVSGARAAPTRPLLLPAHTLSLSSFHSHQVSSVCPTLFKHKGTHLASRLGPLTNHHLPPSRRYPSRGNISFFR